jgi:tRNA-splicing ligase RtcB
MEKNNKIEIKKVNDYTWEIPKSGKMNVPGIIYASEKMIRDMQRDKTLQQVKNVASLPGIVKASFAMPDAHQGYGFPIGGVAAFDMEKGVISPGGVGYDIDCSVRLLSTNIALVDFMKKRNEILHAIFRSVPSGVGKGSQFNINYAELDKVLEGGAEWAVKKGYGIEDDLKHLEEGGKLGPCNANDVSKRAKSRGIGQLGTLGAGNHFLEIQKVDKIFDEKKAKEFGISQGNILIMIHCGSRGLGHQVASDYIKLMEDKYGFKDLPDRELINAPINSELGKKYLSAMNCAANFAFANKQIITDNLRKQLQYYFPKSELKTVYEVCHNIAKIEQHIVDGKKMKLCVHRKGATRAFDGQPVLIPGSMGTASYILIGTSRAEEISFGSTAHGAGRVESRTQARKEMTGKEVVEELSSKDIVVEAGSYSGLVEEAPQSYKDIDEVVKISYEVGLGKIVARLVPLAVMKG